MPDMHLTSLIADPYQDDPDLTYIFEIPGLKWVFVGAKTRRESRKIERLQEKYSKPFLPTDDPKADPVPNPDYDPNMEYLNLLLAACTISFEGPLTYYHKNFKAPVLDDEGNEVIDPKTGRVKTKKSPLAGKKMQPTPDVIATFGEHLLADINNGLGEHWFGRTASEQDDFPGESAPVDESEPEGV